MGKGKLRESIGTQSINLLKGVRAKVRVMVRVIVRVRVSLRVMVRVWVAR